MQKKTYEEEKENAETSSEDIPELLFIEEKNAILSSSDGEYTWTWEIVQL